MSALSTGRRTAIGLSLATAIVAGWLALHIAAVFLLPLDGPGAWLWPLHVLVQTWLSVGLFIVAHDAMHGSLAPGRERANRFVGQLCVGLYAAFPYDRLWRSHHGHHAQPGTHEDPDFHPARPRDFLPWFVRFFRTYFGWQQLVVLGGVAALYLLAGARPLNLLLGWALPALLSALQLFTVGTWLPHRHAGAPDFADAHRARSLDWPWLPSLFACFHFGLHLEHHRAPHEPWWRLPAVRAGA